MDTNFKLIVFGLSGIIYDATQSNRLINIPDEILEGSKTTTWLADTPSVENLINTLTSKDQDGNSFEVEVDLEETRVSYKPYDIHYTIFRTDDIIKNNRDNAISAIIRDIIENGINKKDGVTVKFHYSYVFELLYYSKITDLMALTKANLEYISNNTKIKSLAEKYDRLDVFNELVRKSSLQ